jgi:hypothetical protein
VGKEVDCWEIVIFRNDAQIAAVGVKTWWDQGIGAGYVPLSLEIDTYLS